MKQQKHILFISYDGMTDPLGQSQVIPYLQGLSKLGYRIFLLSCEKKEAYQKHQHEISAILKNANINWTALSYTKKPPVLSTIIDIIHLKKEARKIHNRHAIDLVHTRPGIPALVGLWMKKKFGTKFLNDIREFYADSRVEGGMWNKNNFLYKKVYQYFKQQEAEQVKNSDGIVCLTHAAKKIILQWPEYRTNTPVTVIPCSVDLQLFDTNHLQEEMVLTFKNKLHISNDDFIVSYLGSIGGWYMTDEMMQFCKIISDNIPNAKFLFISPHRHEQIVQAAERFNIPTGSIVTVNAKRSEVPALLSLSTYSLFFIKPCYSKLSSSPTKHGEIMAMGIPVITNAGVGDVKEIVEQYHAGFVVNDFSASEYVKIVTRMKNKMSFNAQEIRKGATDVYSLQNAINKYADLYKQILG